MDISAQGRKALTAVLKTETQLSQAFVSQLVNGLRNPSLEVAFIIKNSTGIPIEFWFEKDRGAAWAEMEKERNK